MFSVPVRVRFWLAFVLCGVAGFGAVVLFAGELKAGVHRPHTRIRVTQKCEKLGCAQVGDTVSYVIRGRVVSVSEPQPGVVCVQTGSSRQAGQVCEPR